jgi:glutathione synthase/RimK-type ligase-like ATP-grasp enzyme
VPPRIAIASCDALLPDGDVDDQILVQVLAARGVDVRVVSWSDPTADWSAVDLTVLRSTWDYSKRRAEFLRWLPTVPNLQNPAAIVENNSDKSYLEGLIAAGLPVTPTSFARPGKPVELPSQGQFVLKPSVGAGSRGAGRFDADRVGERERAQRHAAQLHEAGRTVLIQPYLTDVDSLGETGLIFIDGVFSHAIRKGRMLAEGAAFAANGDSLFIEENITARLPSGAERLAAERILSHLTVNGPLLYARIDLLPGPDGPLLVEAELTEPSLFYEHGPGSVELLADAMLRRLNRGDPA